MSPFEALNILFANRDKNFAQRALHPSQSPLLDNGFLSDPSSHSMAWGTDEKGKPWVYPTVIQAQPGGWLQRLSDMQAWSHAARTGEMIPFKNPMQADQFARGAYKTTKSGNGGSYVPFYKR